MRTFSLGFLSALVASIDAVVYAAPTVYLAGDSTMAATGANDGSTAGKYVPTI